MISVMMTSLGSRNKLQVRPEPCVVGIVREPRGWADGHHSGDVFEHGASFKVRQKDIVHRGELRAAPPLKTYQEAL